MSHLPGRAMAAALLALFVATTAVCLTLAAPQVAAAATVSVVDFGAKGNGVTNDSAAIQAAVNAGSAPRTVVFPAGDYVFSNVYLKSDTSLVFQAGARGLGPTNATVADVFFGAVGTAAAPLRNVSLTSGRFVGRPSMGGVLVAKYADGVTATGVSSTSVTKNIASNLSSNVTVRDCVAENGRWGFAFEESEHILVTGSTAVNMTRDGILFYEWCDDVTASGNYVRTYMTGGDVGVGGIQIYGSTNATIVDNTVLDGRYDSAGIRFRDSNVFWCEGNYVSSPGSSAYQVARVGDFPGLDGGDGTFVGNTAVGSKLRGFDIANPLSDAVKIIDNQIFTTTSSSAASAGMGIVAIPSNCVVVGNRIQTATGAGIQTGGSGQLVAWNSVRNVGSINFGPRVGVFVTGTSHAVVQNEIVDDLHNITNGVRVYTSSSAVLKDNYISGQTAAAYDIRGTQLSTVRSDSEAPSVLGSLTPLGGSESQVVVTATDRGSGIVAVAVSVDGGSRQVYPGASATVSVDDAHWVTCTAIDAAGNVGSKTVYGPPVADTTIDRVSGDNRYSTSVEVSKRAYPQGAGVVLIATGRNYPDALAGAVLAHAEDGPLLLVSGEVPDVVVAEIDRLNATRAIILGGTSAVSADVAATLGGMLGAGNVKRLAGTSRYDTARLIAEATRTKLGSIPSGTAVIASGTNFPDALAVSPLAAARGWPILLTDPASVPTPTSTGLKSLGITNTLVVGGEASVSSAVMTRIPSPRRIGGPDRYSTAALIADYSVDNGLRYSYVSLATGRDFPDALSGAVLTAKNNGVMFLTPADSLNASAAQRLAENKAACERLEAYGGLSVVSDAVMDGVAAAMD